MHLMFKELFIETDAEDLPAEVCRMAAETGLMTGEQDGVNRAGGAAIGDGRATGRDRRGRELPSMAGTSTSSLPARKGPAVG